MAVIQGSLKDVTSQAATVREVLIRPTRTRPSGDGLVVDEPVRVQVDEAGAVRLVVEEGPAVLILVRQSNTPYPGATELEPVPIIVKDGLSLAQAVKAAQSTEEVSESEVQRIAAEVQVMVNRAEDARRGAITAKDEAVRAQGAVEKSAQAATSAQQVAEASAQAAARSETQAQAHAKAAEGNAARADEAKQSAEVSKQGASESARLAGVQAGQALSHKSAAQSEARNAATSATKAEGHERRAAQIIADGIPTGGVHLKHLASEVTGDVDKRVKDAIDKLVNGAPDALDTLKELADAVQSGKTQADDLIKLINLRLTKSEAELTYATKSELSGKADVSHTHGVSQITGLAAQLAGKVDSSDPRLSDARTPRPHRMVEHSDWPGNIKPPMFLPVGYSTACRMPDGQLRVKETPTDKDHAASKSYVDQQVRSASPSVSKQTFAGGKGVVRRQGNVVVIQLNECRNGDWNSWTVPSGFRPTETVSTAVVSDSGNVFYVKVETSGRTSIDGYYAIGDNSRVNGVVTYIVD
ncbi:hypothetical protein [Corynebacterium argentoratense]|uniref:hypothetical protein n=1 Tax=Corynebacterium argentoratense TaxID=42817 RepID=UPI001F25FCBD|nr:hypothetical protein [Corynebacterium argentoratense]MCF1713000.1 hypothetical protein [Corynebacterium argentoratense]